MFGLKETGREDVNWVHPAHSRDNGVPVFIDNGRFYFESFQFTSQLILKCLYWHYISSESNS